MTAAPVTAPAHRLRATTTVPLRSHYELQALGVEHFFLMTGRDNQLWIAMDAVGIRQILARSEAAAVYMADAYARLLGTTDVRLRCRMAPARPTSPAPWLSPTGRAAPSSP